LPLDCFVDSKNIFTDIGAEEKWDCERRKKRRRNLGFKKSDEKKFNPKLPIRGMDGVSTITFNFRIFKTKI